MPAGRFNYADWDATGHMRNIRCPVFVAYGTTDMAVPQIQGAWILRETLRDAGNDAITIRYYDANHGMRTGEDSRLSAEFIGDVAD